MRVVTIVGARPQFIKAAPVSRALRQRHVEVLVHSGQHYGYGMSDVFFEELGIPRPDVNLEVGSGGHGAQTGLMLGGLETLLSEELPDVVIVYGDTNTTLAAALAGAKLRIPVAHVEAGLRSFNRSMPEEINRVVADHVSDVLLAPTVTAVENLAAEGITDGVELVGDVMLDAARHFAETSDFDQVLDRFEVARGSFHLATVHRAGNSDDQERLAAIVRAFGRVDRPVIWAVHPRTRANLEAFGLTGLVETQENVRVVDPVSYKEGIALLASSASLLTDSGGMQKEAYFFGVPCVTLRDETEWVETVDLGWNVLTGADEDAIVAAVASATTPSSRPDVYGNGHAAEKIVSVLEARYEQR